MHPSNSERNTKVGFSLDSKLPQKPVQNSTQRKPNFLTGCLAQRISAIYRPNFKAFDWSSNLIGQYLLDERHAQIIAKAAMPKRIEEQKREIKQRD